MAHWNKKQEILKEEHFEKDVLQITDEEYHKFKIYKGLGLIDMELSEYINKLAKEKKIINFKIKEYEKEIFSD